MNVSSAQLAAGNRTWQDAKGHVWPIDRDDPDWNDERCKRCGRQFANNIRRCDGVMVKAARRKTKE